MEPLLTSLDHVVIAVRDLPAATESYSRLLGRLPSWRGRHPENGTANSLFRLRNTYLELLAPAGHGALAAPVASWLESRGEGILALAFGTGDASACAAALRERGLSVSDPAEGQGVESATGAERSWRNVFVPPADAGGVHLFAIEHRSPPESLPPAEVLGVGPASVAGIDHVVVTTSAPDSAIVLYRDRLGLRLALDRTFEQWGMRLLFFRIGGVTVEVAHALQGGDPEPDRLWGISYRVPDVDAAHSRLVGAGFDISEIRTGRRPGTRVFTVRSGTHGVATLILG